MRLFRLILICCIWSGSTGFASAPPKAITGLTLQLPTEPPSGKQVLIAQPLGRKGPTSIRYFPLAERELKEAHNPTDPADGRYYKRDRDLGQTFTIPGEATVRLDAITLRVGPVSDGSFSGAAGAKVSLQLLSVTGEAEILDNHTTAIGLTVSQGYPGKPRADDYIVGETYQHLVVARGATLPARLQTGQGNTAHPTPESTGSLLRFVFPPASSIQLHAGQTYAFMLMFDEADTDRALPLDNWDYTHDDNAPRDQRLEGPYAGGHGIRREGSIDLPWTRTDEVFTPDQTASHFPDWSTRLHMQPSTWGRPDVDTWRDLTFWIEATPID